MFVIGCALSLALAVAAYVDGGEEPLRAIRQPVAVPPLGAATEPSDRLQSGGLSGAVSTVGVTW